MSCCIGSIEPSLNRYTAVFKPVVGDSEVRIVFSHIVATCASQAVQIAMLMLNNSDEYTLVSSVDDAFLERLRKE